MGGDASQPLRESDWYLRHRLLSQRTVVAAVVSLGIFNG